MIIPEDPTNGTNNNGNCNVNEIQLTDLNLANGTYIPPKDCNVKVDNDDANTNNNSVIINTSTSSTDENQNL
jgi:hypothetical protein